MNSKDADSTLPAMSQNDALTSSVSTGDVSARPHETSARRRTSASSASMSVSATVHRLYCDPYAKAISWRKKQGEASTESVHSADAVVDSKGGDASSARPPVQATSPSPPQTSARHGDMKQRSSSPKGAVDGVSSPSSSSLPATVSEAVCVVLPATLARATPRVSAAASGGRLDLRSRGLTMLPCLHLSRMGEATARKNCPPGAESARTEVEEAGATAHSSGDAAALCLHALNLRQNCICTLLTPITPTSTSGCAGNTHLSTDSTNLSGGPRSTPLTCYAYLSSLDLTRNALTSIAGVEALRYLRSLRLAFNQLTSLAPLWASPYVAELDVLDVSSNALTELMTVEDVHALEGHHVRIVTHPTQARTTTGGQRGTKSMNTYKTMRLRVLYASNNVLRTIPSAIYTFSRLTDLQLHKNEIDSVPEGFPSRVCLPALTRLDLSMNRLPASVVAAATARVENGAGATPHSHRNGEQAECGTGSSARRARQLGDEPSASSPSSAVAATSVGRAASQRHRHSSSAAIQLEVSHDVATTVAESSGADKRHNAAVALSDANAKTTSTLSSPAPPSNQAVKTSMTNGKPAERPAQSSPSPSRSRKAQQRSRALDEAAAVLSPSQKPHRASSVKREEELTKVGITHSSSTHIVAPVRPVPTYEEAVQSLGENVYCVNVRQWAARLRHNLSAATESTGEAAAEEGEGAAASALFPFTAQEVLVALSDSVGSCVTATIASASAGGGGAAASKNVRPRLANSARVIAALLQLLPSPNTLAFPEDSQTRAPPLLILTGISDAVVAGSQDLLIYQILAHHLVQQCLCTPKTTSAVTTNGGASAPASPLPPPQTAARLASPLLDYRRTNSTLLNPPFSVSPPPPASRVLSPPPTSSTTSTSWRNFNSNSSAADRGGRFGAGASAASRQVSFHTPLQVVHVLECPNHTSTSSSGDQNLNGTPSFNSSGSLLLWGYVAWRQSWESAVARRRVRHHNTFVCEVAKCGVGSGPPSSPDSPQEPAFSPNEAVGDGSAAAAAAVAQAASASVRCAAELCPFSCRAAPTRLFEEQRLRDVRPASYSPLPAPWAVLYEQLYRLSNSSNGGGGGDSSEWPSTSASRSSLPPPLSGASSRVSMMHDCPVSLNCLLLCAVELPSSAPSTSSSNVTPTSSSVFSSQSSFHCMGSAVNTATAESSSIHRRRTPATPQAERDAIAQTVQWQRCRQRLVQRIDMETTTVAEEQVQPCAMPFYSHDDVQKSQQAALRSFSSLTDGWQKLTLLDREKFAAGQGAAERFDAPAPEESACDE